MLYFCRIHGTSTPPKQTPLEGDQASCAEGSFYEKGRVCFQHLFLNCVVGNKTGKGQTRNGCRGYEKHTVKKKRLVNGDCSS